jgi:hypothetical protein
MRLQHWLPRRRRPADLWSRDLLAQRCQLCQLEVVGPPVCALIADDTVTDAGDASLAGRRLLTACSRQHLAVLVARHEGGDVTPT